MEYTKEQLVSYAKQTAQVHNINDLYFFRQINQESGFNPKAHNNASGADGIAQIIPHWHPGVDTTNPIASLDYAAKFVRQKLDRYEDKPNPYMYALAAYNWGPGNVEGYTKQDGTIVPPWNGKFEDLPEETQTYIKIILGEDFMPDARQYGPIVPDEIIKQYPDDWTCSIRSLYAALYAMYVQGEIPWMPTWRDGGPYDVFPMMVPVYANSSVGLLEGSGNGIVRVLDRLGIPSVAYQTVSLSQAQEVAGTRPVLIGAHNMFLVGHWMYLYGINSEQLLQLGNPAKNAWYNITNEIRDSWNKPQFAPWSMVVIGKPETGQQKTPTASLDKASLANLVGNAYHTTGVLVPALTSIANNTSLDVYNMRHEIRNVINWLLDQNLG